MTNIKKITQFITLASFLCCSTMASAQKAGDLIFSVGAAYIKPNASLGPLSSTSPTFTSVLNGATASISGISTMTLGGLYMFTDQIAAEVTIGIPPKMTVDMVAPGAVALGQPTSHPGAASAKEFNPSIVAKYMFNNPGDNFRPYVGLGVTNTTFQSVTANTSDATVALLAGTSASLSSATAPIYNAGVIYNIDAKWSINGSVSYVPIKTDVTFVGAGQGAGVTTKGTLTLNPWDYVIRVGYKF